MKRSSFLLLFIWFAVYGCSSLPGDGGTSTIQGKVYVERYNDAGILYQEYYGGEVRVYLVYGDNVGFDDDTRTSYDGSYKFPYLRKGTYTVYAYSDCLTCNGSVEVVKTEVEITDNNQVLELEDIVIAVR